jgi:hypothetical protein
MSRNVGERKVFQDGRGGREIILDEVLDHPSKVLYDYVQGSAF